MSDDNQPIKSQIARPDFGPLYQTSKRDFTKRADLIEWMDLPVSQTLLRGCLRDIARLNRWTGAYRPILRWIAGLRQVCVGTEVLTIIDVGCGYGDLLRGIHAFAAKHNIPVHLIGIDLNPGAIHAAKEATPPEVKIDWLVGDVLTTPLPQPVDIVVSSLMTHHLSDSDVIEFLKWMELNTRLGWYINDLLRSRGAFYLFRLAIQMPGWHPFVRNDGAVSIQRAFVAEDWQRLTTSAGIPLKGAVIRRDGLFRLNVNRRKTTATSHRNG